MSWNRQEKTYDGTVKIWAWATGEKIYRAQISWGMPRLTRRSRRWFTRATDADIYGRKLVARYNRMIRQPEREIIDGE
jgi:hypothetical protein